jgi:outer membrane protein OmpA-like peptidoglycan-associated protein
MRINHRLSLLSAVFLTMLPAAAFAQNRQDGEFSVQRFEPAPGTKNFLTVDGVRMDGGWGWSAGVFFNYSRNPFVLKSCRSQTDCSSPNATNINDVSVISDMFTWDILAAVSPAKFLQIGLRLPLTYVNGSGIDVAAGTPAQDGLKGFGVGDPTLEGKFRFFGGAQDPFALGGALDLSAPLGHATAEQKYIGNSSPITVGVRGIFDGNVKNFSFGANLRALIRSDASIASTTVGPEFRYGAAVGYRVSPILRLLAEGYGGTRFSATNGTNSLEIDGAAEVTTLSSQVIVRIGGGAGIIQGVGVPAARGFLGVAFAHDVADSDGDGLDDQHDQCPTKPEDKDGFEDTDGCPDYDNDQDKIPDDKDKCPNKPETVNGFQDADGCPDEVSDRDKDGIPDTEDKCPDEPGDPKNLIRTPGPNYGCMDRDHDGVPDAKDKCPDQPEDTDGFEDTDGCPDPDNDKDGIPDERDECIDQPEVMNGFQDNDGCPDEPPDRDHDGIPDARDKCPDVPENYNGFEDTDGCPDKGTALVKVTDDGIQILQRVEFATSSDKITGNTSFKVLDAVVGAMKGHPEIFLVEVAGHTDNVGDAATNKALSQKRADAVLAYIVGKGIDKNRLQAKGYGPDAPIADNKTGLGRQKNRRVEFNILKSAKKNPGEPNKVQGTQAPAPGAPPATPPAPPPPAAPAAPPKKK